MTSDDYLGFLETLLRHGYTLSEEGGRFILKRGEDDWSKSYSVLSILEALHRTLMAGAIEQRIADFEGAPTT